MVTKFTRLELVGKFEVHIGVRGHVIYGTIGTLCTQVSHSRVVLIELDAFVFLWSESSTRVVVVVSPDRKDEFLAMCAAKSFLVAEIGVVASSSSSVELNGVFGETISLDIEELRLISEATLPRLFG
jgi:hypothetical protein